MASNDHEHANGASAEAGPGPSSVASSGILSPLSPRASAELPTSLPRLSSSPAGLEAELERTRAEKDHLSNQYRTLLGKLTAMRNSLGEKLKEDAEELDRRETVITTLTAENTALQESMATLRSELENGGAESAALSAQLHQLRSQSDSSSSDVLSLTREMRELRGEMERLRAEREEWQAEAERERERRESMEEEVRATERREREGKAHWDKAEDELEAERERAANLQEVLSEFQQAKDSELRQATAELEGQLKMAVGQLSEFKLRAANAESSLSSVSSDASKCKALERDLRDKNAIIAKLRHDEALRRLRKNTSDNNVDRRLVTNILLSFLTTSRADSKRFEMLSLLSTILSWDDGERERAGLQRGAKRPAAPRRKSSGRPERTADEESAMNESFSNLFVEFLLKEASHGQPDPHQILHGEPANARSPPPSSYPSSLTMSPPTSGAATPPQAEFLVQRVWGYGFGLGYPGASPTPGGGDGSTASLDGMVRGIGIGRKQSFGLQEALGRPPQQ
ncbi:uncharacterized protein EHS24_004027 [Apiotrichum porosum]|uniref:GRIP domain-containing protein n=1 Tax=Apiotrichum porosum TaxID=105984 RepID=A0A427Y451_9TREE|nr:uncharacterized protein EHS24_004027 [Apiotrichum porosum]RSH85847.1 hypothetical protein EHS24_004027 [Apiotrichum porosum]